MKLLILVKKKVVYKYLLKRGHIFVFLAEKPFDNSQLKYVLK